MSRKLLPVLSDSQSRWMWGMPQRGAEFPAPCNETLNFHGESAGSSVAGLGFSLRAFSSSSGGKGLRSEWSEDGFSRLLAASDVDLSDVLLTASCFPLVSAFLVELNLSAAFCWRWWCCKERPASSLLHKPVWHSRVCPGVRCLPWDCLCVVFLPLKEILVQVMLFSF